MKYGGIFNLVREVGRDLWRALINCVSCVGYGAAAARKPLEMQ